MSYRDEERVWLETVVLIEAAAVFWLSAMSLILLARAAMTAEGRARRTAALVLAGICGGQGLEAGLWLWQGVPETEDGWLTAALLLSRSLVLAATALLWLLLVRASFSRPKGTGDDPVRGRD